MHSEDGVTFHISVFLSIPPVASKTERTESHVSALLFHLPFRYLINLVYSFYYVFYFMKFNFS